MKVSANKERVCGMQMDERKKRILLAIIQDYIATAEPVGSRTISRKYELGVSPATVRNEMSDLEELGFIEQPHTSAGRIPSDQGYRYYVDCLMEKHQLTEDVQSFVRSGYEAKKQEIGQVINLTSSLLSQMTNYTSLVMGPQMGGTAIKHVQIVPLEAGKVLVVVINQSGIVQNKMLNVSENITYEDLNGISRILNAKLQGQSLEDIKRTLLSEIYFELSKHNEIFNVVMDLMANQSLLKEEERVYLGGTLNILNQPEFRNIEKVKTLLGLLDHEEDLKNLLTSTPKENGVIIKIGGENKMAGIKDCSMITATYHVDDKVVGSIGILGPTRMDYAKVVSVVDFINNNLSEILSNYFKRL
jgi:heat-inducible transcriptional repressor